MAILSFTKDNRIDDFTYVLVRKDNVKIGTIKARNVDYTHNFNGPDELSLKVYKELDNERNPYWDRINDYNDLCVVQLGDDGYFEIEVTINEDSEGVYKSITATSRCEAELSHAKIYDCQINTEEDMLYDSIHTWDKDNVTLLYRDTTELERLIEQETDEKRKQELIAELNQMKYRSIMHRLLDKLPNYSIAHVDATLVELTDWYQFEWDDTDVYSILSGDLSEQYNVLFTFNSKDRTISLYDLFSVCQNNNCGYRQMMQKERNINTRYRADFHHACPYCESTDITPGYGKFTKIIVSKDNLTTSAQVSSNKDSLINCFRVSGGDDLMDAAIINQNPNGSAYFYQFSEENMEEMPEELVNKIQEYNEEYDAWYKGDETNNKGVYTFTPEQVSSFNGLVDYVINHFDEKTSDQFIKLKEDGRYVGYRTLAVMFYNIMDLQAFFEYSMAPDVVVNHDTLDKTIELIEGMFTGADATKIAVTDPSLSRIQKSVESAILQSIRCIINTALYEVSVDTETAPVWTPAVDKEHNGSWVGKIKVVAIEYKGTDKEEDNTAITQTLNIIVNYNVADYSIQMVEALITRKDAKVTPITDISDANLKQLKVEGTDLDDINWTDFDNVLHTYSLNTLSEVIRPCYVEAQNIIFQSGNAVNGLFYDYYTECLRRIDEEVSFRQQQLNSIESIMGVVINYRTITHEALDFEKFLGETLYKVFCNYRREDTYRNDNYISDDLDNNTIFQRAGDLIDYAQKELYKVSHLQFEVSGNLNNLLALPEFAPIKDDFEVGNWIKLAVDDKLYDLRLLSYSINFDDIQTINVDFSTVETIWMGNSDIQSVLKAAGSMAGSYNNVQLQVKNNQKTTKEVNKWVSEGMSATQTRFTNDPTTQEITYDSTGLMAKGYEDTTGEYYPQQLKINKNGIYLTDNNWQTIRTGVGAITFTNPSTGVTSDAYGIIGEAIVGKMLLGEQLIISNVGATFVMDDKGLTIKNKNGDRVFYADTNGNLVIQGTITAGSGSTIGPWTVGDTYIRNGNIANATNTSVNGVYLGTDGLNVSGGTAATTTYITKSAANIGNKLIWNGTTLSVDGNITATNLTATSTGTIGPWKISNNALYRGSASYGGVDINNGDAYIGVDGISFAGKNIQIGTSEQYGGVTYYAKNGTYTLEVGIKPGGSGRAFIRASGTSGSIAGGAYLELSPLVDIKGNLMVEETSRFLDNITIGGDNRPDGSAAYLNGPSRKISIQCNSEARAGIYDNTNGKWIISSESAGLPIKCWGTTIVSSSSDVRLKENIKKVEIKSALDTLNQFKMHSFDWKRNEDVDHYGQHWKIGMIADEIEELDPMFVGGGGYEMDQGKEVLNKKYIDTFYLIGYLVKAIQELSAEQSRLKNKLKELKGE